MNKIRSCIRHIRKPGLAYLVIFLGAFGFFLSLYKYDFFIEDEGLYLYETLRIYKGQLPYRDFRVGYTRTTSIAYLDLFYECQLYALTLCPGPKDTPYPLGHYPLPPIFIVKTRGLWLFSVVA